MTEYAPYIRLSASLLIAGGELIEMAGAVNERREADDSKLKRAETAVRKAAEALAEYRRIDDADPVITWPRPSYHKQAGSLSDVYADAAHVVVEGMRWEDVGLPMAPLAALNGDDPEAA